MTSSQPLGKLVVQSTLTDQLTSAASSGDVSQLESILSQWQEEASPDPETLLTAALSAAQSDQPQTLRYLLSHGAPADPIIATTSVATATPEIFDALWDAGWRPEHNDPREDARRPGEMPILLRAIGSSNIPIVTWLLNHINTQSSSSTSRSGPPTPLSLTAGTGSLPLLTLLLSPPHNFALQDSNALHAAVRAPSQKNQIPVMQHLLDFGIDIDALEVVEGKGRSSKERGTALQAAIQAGEVERAKWLLEHGADGMVKSESGLTAMDWARECESSSDMVDVLRVNGCQ